MAKTRGDQDKLIAEIEILREELKLVEQALRTLAEEGISEEELYLENESTAESTRQDRKAKTKASSKPLKERNKECLKTGKLAGNTKARTWTSENQRSASRTRVDD